MSNLEKIKEISTRMKDLREIEDLSQEELAKKLGIEVEVYRQYEEAACDIPIGFLNEVAKLFHVELMALLSGEEPKLQKYDVVRKGHGLKIDRRKQYDYRHLSYNFMNKKLEPFLVKVPLTEESQPIICSRHEGQEFNYVLKGRLKVLINSREIILEEGDSIYFDASCPHGMKALGDLEPEFLAIIVQ